MEQRILVNSARTVVKQIQQTQSGSAQNATQKILVTSATTVEKRNRHNDLTKGPDSGPFHVKKDMKIIDQERYKRQLQSNNLIGILLGLSSIALFIILLILSKALTR